MSGRSIAESNHVTKQRVAPTADCIFQAPEICGCDNVDILGEIKPFYIQDLPLALEVETRKYAVTNVTNFQGT